MKSTKRTLPRETTYEQRAIALAKRLGIDIPQQPLTDIQRLTLWAEIGKILLPIKPPQPSTLKQLWADVGMYLAELREPEFQWGRGRRRGSKSRVLSLNATPDAMRKRRERKRKSETLLSVLRRDKY